MLPVIHVAARIISRETLRWLSGPDNQVIAVWFLTRLNEARKSRCTIVREL